MYIRWGATIAALTLLASGAAASTASASSTTTAVRTAAKELYAADYSRDGARYCELMIPSLQQIYVSDAVEALHLKGLPSCAQAMDAFLKSSPMSRADLAEMNATIAVTPVKVSGDTANILLTDPGSTATDQTFLHTGNRWLYDGPNGPLPNQQGLQAENIATMESCEGTAYFAAKFSTASTASPGHYATGSKLVEEITGNTPWLKGTITVTVKPTAMNGKISVAGTTATSFKAVGVTLSGQTVTYTVTVSGAAKYVVSG